MIKYKNISNWLVCDLKKLETFEYENHWIEARGSDVLLVWRESEW